MASRELREPTVLILDFDGTLTINDTMAILGTLPKKPPISWHAVSEAYMEDYRAYKATLIPSKVYDENAYISWIRSRKSVEQRSAQRVQDAGFFRSVTYDDVQTAVAAALKDGRLQFRDGWLDLFSLFVSDAIAVKISIISVNWSAIFIRLALREAARRSEHPSKEAILAYIDSMYIQANEIQGLDRPDGSSGVICDLNGFDIQTSHDKLSRMPNVSTGPISFANPLVVYVGDSSTDFEALLNARVGVWICDVKEEEHQTAFKKAFHPFTGFVPQPLASGKPAPGRFYWTPDLHHVIEALTISPSRTRSCWY